MGDLCLCRREAAYTLQNQRGHFFFGQVVAWDIGMFYGDIEHKLPFFDQQGDGAGAPNSVFSYTRNVFFIGASAVAAQHLHLLFGMHFGVVKQLYHEPVGRVEVFRAFFFIVALAFLPIGFLPGAEAKNLIGQ